MSNQSHKSSEGRVAMIVAAVIFVSIIAFVGMMTEGWFIHHDGPHTTQTAVTK